MPERFILRDDIDRGQVPLDSQQEGFWHIPGTSLSRELGRVRRAVQHYLDVLADSVPVILTKARFEFLEMHIVSIDLVLCIGNLPVIRPACLSDLPEPVRFAVLVIGLGMVECPPGFVACSLVTLLAAEHPLEHSRRFRLEVRPLRSRDRDGKLP